jgi:hypothetical protein
MDKTKISGKSKLTLSVDKEIVSKAKNLGLNLSEITENVLRSFTFTPNSMDKESLYGGYRSLFDTMLPLLKDYDESVLVAKWTEIDVEGKNLFEFEWYLTQDGTFWNLDFEKEVKDIKSIPSYGFLEPIKILSNFISALSSAKEKRKEKLEQIELAKKILEAIISSVSERGSKANKTADVREAGKD